MAPVKRGGGGGVNRHTAWHNGPCPWSCSFVWCLAEGWRIRDQCHPVGQTAVEELNCLFDPITHLS